MNCTFLLATKFLSIRHESFFKLNRNRHTIVYWFFLFFFGFFFFFFFFFFFLTFFFFFFFFSVFFFFFFFMFFQADSDFLYLKLNAANKWQKVIFRHIKFFFWYYECSKVMYFCRFSFSILLDLKHCLNKGFFKGKSLPGSMQTC